MQIDKNVHATFQAFIVLQSVMFMIKVWSNDIKH